VLAVLESGWVIAGPRVGRLEHELSSYLGVEHLRALSSCTAGLLLALRLADVQRDDEVLLPANTFVACANVIEQAGARPVLVDCDPSTGLIDLDQAEAMVGPRTRALMPVHLGGRPLDMDALGDLRDRHGLTIIEDAAHAIGAQWGGRCIGAHGNLVSFSFHAAKNITTVEGGALVVRSEQEATRVECLAAQGLTRSSWSRHGRSGPADYDVAEPGFKLRMTDVAAAIGVHQLPRLEGWLVRREALARRYDVLLADLPLELAPPLPDHARHARHLYTVKIGREAPSDRAEVIRRLADHNIGTSVHFQGIHRQSFFRERYGLRDADLPHATDWALRSLSLPLHPGVSDADQDDVVHVLAEALQGPLR
jgi:dTDP-4-amino-4,6-dideoxygalactose transaminase